MIYTSYFAKLKEAINPISVCGRAPEWYTGPQYKKLAPKLWFFKEYKEGKITAAEYTHYYYNEVLKPLDPKQVYKELQHIYNQDDFTLICYEIPTDFCHRHLILKWFEINGYKVKKERASRNNKESSAE